MDKKRLEEAKEYIKYRRGVMSTYLRELLSTVEEQQKEIEKLQQIRKNVANAHQDNMQKINSENARLREALEDIKSLAGRDGMHSFSYEQIARQALEEST